MRTRGITTLLDRASFQVKALFFHKTQEFVGRVCKTCTGTSDTPPPPTVANTHYHCVHIDCLVCKHSVNVDKWCQ